MQTGLALSGDSDRPCSTRLWAKQQPGMLCTVEKLLFIFYFLFLKGSNMRG